MNQSPGRFSAPLVQILLVEEDPDTISTVSTLLSKIPDAQFTIASSFADALLAILEKPPHLILFGHVLPGRDSLEVFTSIRNKYPSIHLIVTLPDGNRDLITEYQKAGAADCIIKDENYSARLEVAVKEAILQILSASTIEKAPLVSDQKPSEEWRATLAALEPGQKILHYQIADAIGEGGMGEVYKALDLKLGRTVAIKVLPLTISKDDRARRRLTREAQSASKLNHSGIVTIHAIEEFDDRQFIVMEYVEGKSLRDSLKEGPMSFNRVMDVARQIADALTAAHSAGLIHRDIKPANIMISNQDKVKILDFGLARFAGKIEADAVTKSNLSLTEEGQIQGTLAYMSPEQLKGDELDERTDIFSFGILLYELLRGQRPFRGTTSIQLMQSILNEQPEPLRALQTNLPLALERIIQKALAKDRKDRYAKMKDLQVDLVKLNEPLKEPARPENQDSIAVLYFENLGGLAEGEYLRDGLTEDVITELSKIETLRVFPRSAIIAFRDKPVTAPEIGRQLSAHHVLAGSIRRAGNRVRLNAQLIRSDTGHTIWAERYDRELLDVFDLQDEIAHSLAKALRIKLSPIEEKAIGQKPVQNPEAYDFYLRARRLFRRGTRKDMESAVEMFQKAISLDPNFALAYAGLGHVSGRIHRYYDQNPKWMEQGIQACEQAMRIEPNLPEALSARAFLCYGHKEYEEAIRFAKMALDGKRDCEGAYFALGLALNVTDRLKEAAQVADLAIEMNGDDYNLYAAYVNTFERLGDKERVRRLRHQSLRVCQMLLEWAPENARARMMLAAEHAYFGDLELSLSELEKALAYSPNDASVLLNAACTYGLMGRKKEAMATLKKAVENGYRHADTIARDADLACLHDEPEFHALIKQLSSPSSSNQ